MNRGNLSEELVSKGVCAPVFLAWPQCLGGSPVPGLGIDHPAAGALHHSRDGFLGELFQFERVLCQRDGLATVVGGRLEGEGAGTRRLNFTEILL